MYIKFRSYWPDEPIVQSLADTDFYKFSMGQFIFNNFRDVLVRFGFKNRTSVPLARIIPESRMREELDHVRTLQLTNTELHYLRGTNEYQERMFQEPYLKFLENQRLSSYDLEYRGDNFDLGFGGPWCEASPWEIHGLEIIAELYFREMTKGLSKFDMDVLFAEGQKRLWEKVRILKQNPHIKFSEMGSRRRPERRWQDYEIGVLAEELPRTQFAGTSNVSLAMKHGLLPMGTNAHELQSVIAGLMGDTDEDLRNSQSYMLNLWWKQYGEPLSIFLPDTFGTKSFLKLVTPEMLASWKGFRQDSGDPIAEGELWIKKYKANGIDPAKKLMIPSDGLNVQTMLKIEEHFRNRIQVSFGWGTDLTNDLGIKALSLVIKAISANGIGLVKLSNNPAKAIGAPEDIKRYMRVFGYGRHRSVACKY